MIPAEGGQYKVALATLSRSVFYRGSDLSRSWSCDENLHRSQRGNNIFTPLCLLTSHQGGFSVASISSHRQAEYARNDPLSAITLNHCFPFLISMSSWFGSSDVVRRKYPHVITLRWIRPSSWLPVAVMGITVAVLVASHVLPICALFTTIPYISNRISSFMFPNNSNQPYLINHLNDALNILFD